MRPLIKGWVHSISFRAVGPTWCVVIFGVQGWRWARVRGVRWSSPLDADTTEQQQWRVRARKVALRGTLVAALPAETYGGRRMRVQLGMVPVARGGRGRAAGRRRRKGGRGAEAARAVAKTV